MPLTNLWAEWLSWQRRFCAVSTNLHLHPHVDTGDHVIIINADNLVLTGNKPNKKNGFATPVIPVD
jgi:hypothetical protein